MATLDAHSGEKDTTNVNKASAVDMWKTLRVYHIPTALLLLSMLTLIKTKQKKN